jgi:hypothetical protein
MNELQRIFLAHYAAIGCVSVEQALVRMAADGSAVSTDDYRGWCQQAAFTERLHGMFCSLEVAPEADPLDFPPTPPLTINYRQMGIDLPPLAYDPLGPTLDGRHYDFTRRGFVEWWAVGFLPGKETRTMSEVAPGEVCWVPPDGCWSSIDRAVKRMNGG